MKSYYKIIITILFFGATTLVNGQGHNYGEKITDKGAIPVTELAKKMDGQNELAIKVEGVVLEVCQVKGCWMTLDLGNGEKMRVTFKDYGFFMPKNISGKTVVIEGIASLSTTSVEELKHYAEDAGKTKAEIDKITAPKKEMTFEAAGVIVRN
ncbi:MAG TPA: DUF4920 domain-containing protein [Bacteroidia bacterium]|nr:DUF4920 domain-containing protein [Bacteroidia bacterium]